MRHPPRHLPFPVLTPLQPLVWFSVVGLCTSGWDTRSTCWLPVHGPPSVSITLCLAPIAVLSWLTSCWFTGGNGLSLSNSSSNSNDVSVPQNTSLNSSRVSGMQTGESFLLHFDSRVWIAIVKWREKYNKDWKNVHFRDSTLFRLFYLIELMMCRIRNFYFGCIIGNNQKDKIILLLQDFQLYGAYGAFHVRQNRKQRHIWSVSNFN